MAVTLERPGVDALLAALADRGYTVVGPTVARRRDRLRRAAHDAPTCRSGGPTSRTAATTGCAGATTRRCSATPSARTRGSSSSCRPRCACGARELGEDGSADRDRRAAGARRRATRSSACARASCTRWAILDRVLGPAHRAVRRRRQLRAGGRDVLLRLDGHRPDGDVGLRPRADRGARGRPHYFVVEVGSDDGRRRARRAASAPRRAGEEAAPPTARTRARPTQMGREMDITDIRDLLYRNLEHPRWDDVAERCLTCGNCTMVCPTCFCTTVEDVTDLAGEHVERHQSWDSCFTVDYSHMHGGSVRGSRRVALPPVDDAQAGDLVRPVRHVGLRRLRALHHLVPGRDRHHRGGRGDPRARSRCATLS